MNVRALLAALYATVPCLAVAAHWPGPVVPSDDGPVRGSHANGVTTYHGIPFAKPPVGAMRWTAPQRPTPWTRTRKTTTVGQSCPQFDFVKGVHIGAEDCLYLSVYVPDACTDKNPCPVMQWIYGGAWILGSNYEFGMYDATKFAKRHGVVVVSANYRLDVFGWLALREIQEGTPSGSYGNYGLKDQRAALQWTQRNIRLFHGDPAMVTIFGESAGAWSVCQHTVSPASNGLFSRAIIQSGTCDGPWMIFDGANAKRFGDAYASAAGCTATARGSERVACLRALKLEDAMKPYIDWICLVSSKSTNPYCNKTSASAASEWLQHVDNATEAAVGQGFKEQWPSNMPPFGPMIAFAAVVDGTDEGLPEVPLRLIQAGRINRSPRGEPISVIMGTNTDEFALFTIGIPIIIKGTSLPFNAPDFVKVAQHLLQYHDYWNQTSADKILDHYNSIPYKTPSARITQAGTHFCFRCGTRNAVRAFAKAGIRTYLYQFDYHGSAYLNPNSTLCHLTSEVGCGVFHGSDIRYVFGNFLPAKKISDAMGTYWSNMAKHGSPNGNGAEVVWPIYNKSSDMHLVLGNEIFQSSALSRQHCDMWDSLPRQGPYPH